ncbi:pyridoxamine 5'-phosphate oxidase family protein [Nocardia wallacei]|uniref:pyridoxamine 5'-phosphate oxidase family protein n=1 Tax=Nocardia wallacei TaxID=480035 RepID=UPI002453F131|nr:pyridoxamine 5'-phosphate oxidase family protein [Nocardia wallacei]
MADASGGGRAVVHLDRAESMRLLAGAAVGRIVFTRNALPAIRPVNHLVEDGAVVLRTRFTTQLTTAMGGSSPVVVAYEADDIDAVRRVGWSVVVVGFARPVTDPGRVARYESLLQSWVDGEQATVVSIEPEIVTGMRLVERGC